MAQIQSIDVLCKPSVYLLYDKGALVYVGQSKTPSSRVLQHRRDKTFDSFKILRCRPERRMYWEDRLIYKFRPKYNKQIANRSRMFAAKRTKIMSKHAQVPFPSIMHTSMGLGFTVSSTSSNIFIPQGNTGTLGSTGTFGFGRGDGVTNGNDTLVFSKTHG